MPFKPILLKLSVPFLIITGAISSVKAAVPIISRYRETQVARREVSEQLEGIYHPGRIMVKFKENVTEQEIIEKSEEYTGTEQNVYKPENSEEIVQTVHIKDAPEVTKEIVEDENKLSELQDEYKDELTELMLKYKLDPDVESVDVVHRGEFFWTDSGDQTYSDDYDSIPSYATGSHWYYTKAKLGELWDDQACATGGPLCGGSSDVIVAVIDSGVAYEDYGPTSYEWYGYTYNNITFADAPELTGINLYTNSSDPYGSGDQDGNGFCDDYHGVDMEIWVENWDDEDPGTCSSTSDIQKEGHANDDYGHGTYCTGQIASLTNNASGSVSIAHNVSIMPIKVNIPFTGYIWEDTFYYATVYAVDHGADVISVSLGWCDADSFLKAAVDYAEAAGVVMVIAAGNSTCGWSTPLCYPAQYNDSNVIAVGATNPDDTRTSYSQYGSSLDIVAAVGGDASGEGNETWQQTLNCAWSCTSASNLTTFKMLYSAGTSFATPQVAAAAALVRSKRASATAYDIINTLNGTATDINSSGRDDQTGHGLLNLEETWNNVWSAWTYPIGATAGDVNMAVFNPGSGDRLYQAIRGTDNRIYTRYTSDGDTWSSWVYPIGATAGDINMAVFNPGSGDRLYQTIRGTDNRIYTRYTSDGNTWSSWVYPIGATADDINMAVFNPGSGDRLYQAIRGTDNRIYTRYTSDGDTWSSWVYPIGATAGDINMAVFNPGSGDRLYQAIRGTDNRIYTRYTSDGNTWSSWVYPIGATAGNVNITVFDSKLYQAIRGTDNKIYTRSTSDGTSWSNWTYPIGSTASDVNIVVFNSKLYQSIRGTENFIYTRYTSDGTSWSNWMLNGGTLGNVLTTTFNPGSGERLYQALKGTNYKIFTRYLESS